MSKQKPYYLRQPWDILFRENKLDKVSPWNVNLVLLLTSLLEQMEEEGIDFRLAGTAIHSSVLIYLKKAEMLLKMEELPKPEEEKEEVYLPPAIPLPFRFEHTTTSVDDLIEALEKALSDSSKNATPSLPTLPIPVPDFMEAEDYLLEIENRADALFEEIQWRAQKSEVVKLTELVTNQDFLEIVRIFMMLLFLAQRLKINLEQSEEEMDIYIHVLEEESRVD